MSEPSIEGWATAPVTGDRIDVSANSVVVGGPDGARVEIAGDGIHGYDDVGAQTLRLDGDTNFVTGQFSTAREGMPGVVLTPTKAGGSGIWFTQTGVTSSTEAAIYSQLDGHIRIRPKDSTPKGTVFIDGNLVVNSKTLFNGTVEATGFLTNGAVIVGGVNVMTKIAALEARIAALEA